MRSISIMWLEHRDAELYSKPKPELEKLDPTATAMIAFHDAARKVALGIERGELNPGDVMAEVDQFFLKLQDFMDDQKVALERVEVPTANDPN